MFPYVCVRCANETHVFCGLQVDNGHFPSFALGEEWKVSTGFDLQGGAERQRQVCSSACRQRRNVSQISVTCVLLTPSFTEFPLLVKIVKSKKKKKKEAQSSSTFCPSLSFSCVNITFESHR